MFDRNIASTFVSKVPLAAAVIALGSVLCSGTAGAQGAESSAVTSSTTDPMKVCAASATRVDRVTCLKEVAAAKGEARRGQLTSPNAVYEANALQRCETLPDSDRQQCELRIKGAGSIDGSVGGGGLIREVKTQIPDASPAEAAPLPASGNTGK